MTTPTRPLLTITAEMAQLEAIIAANGGEMNDEVEKQFDALGVDFGAKIDAYLARRSSLLVSLAVCEAEAKAVQEEADRLKARAKRCATAVKDLETRLAIAMKQRGMTEFERGRFRIKATETPGAVLPTVPPPVLSSDYKALPGELQACVRIVPPTTMAYEWDKNALKALHKTNPDAVKAVATVATNLFVTIT